MDTTTKKVSEACSHIEVRATSAEVLNALDDALVVQAVRSGLRPVEGQSAADALRAYTGKENVDELVNGEVPEVLVYRAVEKAGIAAAVSPKVLSHSDIVRGRELTFELEVFPKRDYELSSYEPLEVTVEAFEIKPAEVERQIKQLAESRATYRDAGDRPAQMGDAARLAVVATMDGKPLAALTTRGRVFGLGSGQMPAAFDEGVVGARVGEERTFEFDLPVGEPAVEPLEDPAACEELPDPATAPAARVRCTVTVLGLQEKAVPEVTDAWVRQEMPRFGSVDELRASVRSRMAVASKEDYDAYVRASIVKALTARFDATLDDALLQRACDALTNDLRLRSNREGKTYEEVVLQFGGEQQMAFALMARAHETLVRGFALDAVFRHEGLELTDADIDIACAQIDPANPRAVRAEMARNGRAPALIEAAQRAKATNWVCDHAKVTAVPRA